MIRQSHTSGHPFYSEFTPHHSGSSSVYTQERPQLQSLHTLTSQLPDTRGWGTGFSLCSFIAPAKIHPRLRPARSVRRSLQSPLLYPEPRRAPIFFGIRTSAKRASNPCRMRSFKTLDLKPFRIRSYEKTGEREDPLFRRSCRSVPSLSTVSCRLPASRYILSPCLNWTAAWNLIPPAQRRISSPPCRPNLPFA